MSTEIEAIKKQEMALMTKMEMQRYTESEMQTKLAELQENLEDGQELVRVEVRKLQSKYEVSVEDVYFDEVQKLTSNLNLYRKIIKDPQEYLDELNV